MTASGRGGQPGMKTSTGRAAPRFSLLQRELHALCRALFERQFAHQRQLLAESPEP